MFGSERIAEASKFPERAAARWLRDHGFAGALRTVGVDGRPRLTFKSIAGAAEYQPTETDRGIYIRPYREFGGAELKRIAVQSISGPTGSDLPDDHAEASRRGLREAAE
jgi:hypothetical protein